MMTYEPGAIVRYARPETGEEHLTFVVIEDRDTRVLIKSRDFQDFRIAPQESVEKTEVVCVS